MILATDSQDYGSGALGMVELALSYLNDRTKRYFSKPEIVEYLNHAQSKVAAMITDIHREFFLTSATTPMISGQAYYSLPADLVKLWDIELLDSLTDGSGMNLTSVPLHDREFYELLDDANKKEDYGFYFVAGTSFKLMPVPGTVVTEQARVHYVQRLDALTANADVSLVPAEYHELLVIDAARRGYIKNNRKNAQLESMWTEGVEIMTKNVHSYTPNDELRVSPFFGSYGPGSSIHGYLHGREVE